MGQIKTKNLVSGLQTKKTAVFACEPECGCMGIFSAKQFLLYQLQFAQRHPLLHNLRSIFPGYPSAYLLVKTTAASPSSLF
jgi:hypothetical protein